MGHAIYKQRAGIRTESEGIRRQTSIPAIRRTKARYAAASRSISKKAEGADRAKQARGPGTFPTTAGTSATEARQTNIKGTAHVSQSHDASILPPNPADVEQRSTEGAMITITPIGQDEGRAPRWIEPVIVPKGAQPNRILERDLPVRKKNLLVPLLFFGGLIAALIPPPSPPRKRPRSPKPSLSADVGYAPSPRERQKGQKPVYLWFRSYGRGEPKSVPASKLDYFKRASGRGEGSLFITFAYSADHAREQIRHGELVPYGAEPGKVKTAEEAKKTRVKRETIQERLKPIRDMYLYEVFPETPEFTRALQKRIEQDAYSALGVKKPTDRIMEQEVEFLWLGLKDRHKFIRFAYKEGGRWLEHQKELQRKYRARMKPMPRIRKPARAKPLTKAEQLTLFAGDFPSLGSPGAQAACGLWQEKYSPFYGKPIWKCLKYAPACEPQTPNGEVCVVAPEAEQRRQLRVCVDWKGVKSDPAGRYRGKTIQRCAGYSAVCTTKACLPEPMPKPEMEEEPEISKKEVKALARGMAQEWNESQAAAGPALAREILSRGGIRSYRKGVEKEEYREIPLHLKKKTGLPTDEMAAEMGIDEKELMAAIKKAYPKGRKVERRKKWQDFIPQARDIIMTEHREGLRLGQDLFTAKRELVLTPEDIATADDPLYICLQRMGWNLKRVEEIQESIAEKMTPDLFTGKKGRLTGGEKMLQQQIDECFKRIAKGRRTGKAKQMKLFGLSQVQQEIPLAFRAPEAGDPIPDELDSLALIAKRFPPTDYMTDPIVNRLREAYREIHPFMRLPIRVKGKYPKPLENILAYHYGYASGDPKRSIQAFWYHVHGYAPDHGRLPEEQRYPWAIDDTFRGLSQVQQEFLFPTAKARSDLTVNERKVLEAFKGEKIHIDEVARRTKLSPYKVSAALVMLELKNLAHQSAGKMFEAHVESVGRR